MKTDRSKYSFLNIPDSNTGSERRLSLNSILNLPLGILLLIGIILISLLGTLLIG